MGTSLRKEQAMTAMTITGAVPKAFQGRTEKLTLYAS